MKRFIYVFVLAAAFAVIGISNADALTVSPTSLDFNAKPGDVIRGAVKVTNEGNTIISVSPTTKNWRAKDNSGEPEFIETIKGSSTLADWISVNADTLNVNPGQKTDIPFTISIPSTAPAGSHTAAILWGNADKKVGNQGVGVSGLVGSLVLVNVTGGASQDMATLVQFTTDKGSYSRLPVSFGVKVMNNGNTYVKPVGQIKVTNMFGKEVAAIPFNLDKSAGRVLPSQTRDFSTTWSKEETTFVPSTGIWQEIGKEKRNFGFGKYTARLDGTYGTAGVLTGVVTFWVMPWPLILVYVLAILLVIIIIGLVFKMMNNNQPTPVKKGKK